MGEYAKYKGEKIKIGTCESMYYLRYEDRDKVFHVPGNLDPRRQKNIFFRAPALEEDGMEPGEYDYRLSCKAMPEFFHASLRVKGMPEEAVEDAKASPGLIQLHHRSGLLVNVPCHHGLALPDTGGSDIKVFWNGKRDSLYIEALKNTDEALRVCIGCWECGTMWSFTFPEVVDCICEDRMVLRLYEQCSNYREPWEFPLVRTTRRPHRTKWDPCGEEKVMYKVTRNETGFLLEWSVWGEPGTDSRRFTYYDDLCMFVIDELLTARTEE